jgi:hypothetical protein
MSTNHRKIILDDLRGELELMAFAAREISDLAPPGSREKAALDQMAGRLAMLSSFIVERLTETLAEQSDRCEILH